MPAERVRWGVISTAGIARRAVIPAIQASSNGVVDAIASRDTGRARAAAAELGLARSYGAYDELLRDDEVDAVYVALPNSGHREWTIAAANAGKHVLCEKPLGLNADECAAMATAASAAGVKLMEAFMYRFHPRTRQVVRMLREGTIGPIRSIQTCFTFRLRDRTNIRMDPALGGGALMDVGCYCVNVARTLFGTEPVEAQAFAQWAETGVDEELAGTMRFADGAVAQFECALNQERREWYRVGGPEGALEVSDAFLPGTADAVIHESHGRGDGLIHTVSGVDEYRLMVEHFAECVLHGTPVAYDAIDVAANMRVIDACYRSARDGGQVELVRKE